MQQGPSDVERLFKSGSGNLIAMLRLPTATLGSWLSLFHNGGDRSFGLCRPQVVIVVWLLLRSRLLTPKLKRACLFCYAFNSENSRKRKLRKLEWALDARRIRPQL